MQRDPRAASVSASELIDELYRQDLLDEAKLISVLGADRHDMAIDKVEIAVVEHNVLSAKRLLLLKGMLAGLPTIDDFEGAKADKRLPAAVARASGALLLDVPSHEPIVAFIEDSETNVERVRQALGGVSPAVHLCVATQFVELYKEAYQGIAADPRPPTKDIFEVMDECIRLDGSDIHLSVGEPPVLRVDGELTRMHRQALDERWMRDQVERLLGHDVLQRVLKTHNVDAGYSYGAARFRINVGADSRGMTLAVRKLASRIPSFEDLDLPPAIRRFAELERGLVLVTGPTGSGKSTTLAAILSYIANHQARHLLTLEDPIEFTIPSRKAVVHQRELGSSFVSFADGLKQSLRQDPDVVLVGEARDRETISAAVTAAETGALVFATLHTYDAASTLARIVNTYPADEQDAIRSQMAYVLKGVVSQSLLPSVHGGRVAAFEILVSTPGVANNLRKPDGMNQIKQAIATGGNHGMMTMEAHLASLVRRGIVRESDAEFKARDLDEFRRHLDAPAGGYDI